MKLIKKAILISAITLLSINLYAQENKKPENRLLLYNFTTTDKYDNLKKNEKNYQHYSIIIPDTITKSLNDSGSYKITREEGPFSIETTIRDEKEQKKYIKKLEDLGIKYGSDYIVSGTFNVAKKKLLIQMTIFDVKGKNIRAVNHESTELGVQMKKTTDFLARSITENIDIIVKANKEKFERSPFLTLYKPFSIMTIGFDSGYTYLRGDIASEFKNPLYISPFINFDIGKYLFITTQLTSTRTSSKDNDDGKNGHYNMKIVEGSASLGFLLKFTADFGLAVSAGGGISRATISETPRPFSPTYNHKHFTDPMASISSYFVCNLSALTIRTGVVYKRIMFEKELKLDYAAIFAGAGVHF